MRRRSMKIQVVAGSVIPAFLLLMLNPSQAFAVMRAPRAERDRQVALAKQLGVDPEVLLDPDAYQRKEAVRAEKRRVDAVAAMRSRTGADPAKLAALKKTVREVEDAHAIHAVAGLADDVTDLQHAVERANKDPNAVGTIVALERASLRHGDEAFRSLDRAVKDKLAGLPPKVLRRHQLFVDAARKDYAALAQEVKRATDNDTVNLPRLAGLKHKLAVLGGRDQVVRPLGPPRVEPAVVKAQKDAALFAGPALEAQKFRPGATELVRRVIGGVRGGGRSGLGIAPLLGSLMEGLLGVGVAGELAAPTEIDRAATVDAPRSAAMVAKAAALGNQPVAIFNFVHDTIDTEIYRGSRRGAVGALEEKAGNDTDQASLLIALYRAAGIPARYERIGVRLSPTHWRSYTGVDTAEQAASMLATAGESASVAYVVVEKTVVPHVDTYMTAVRAYVPYGDYRGQVTGQPGQKAWVRLLPALKDYAVRKPVDLRPGATFDFDRYLRSITPDSPLQVWQAQLRKYALEHGLECATLKAAQPLRTIVRENLPYLRLDSPVPVLVTAGVVSELPESEKDFARLRMTAPNGALLFDVPVSFLELYGQRVALTYAPATLEDQAVIDRFGGLESTPLYLINLKGELRIGERIVATSVAQVPGTDNDLLVTLYRGSQTDALISHVSRVGSQYVWALDPGSMPLSRLDEAERALATARGAEAADLARLYLMSVRYFRDYNEARSEIAGIFHSRYLGDASEGLFSYELNVTKVREVPITGRRDTVLLDVGRTLTTPFAIDGKDATRAHQKLLLGHQGSALEHMTPAAFHGPNEYSAVKLIQQAYASGVEVFEFDGAEVDAYLPRLAVDEATREAVANKAKPGRRLRVPQTTFTPPAYRPVYGFVSYDPQTGAAEYTFNGVFDGGGGLVGKPAPGPGTGCETCYTATGKTGSKVILARGNYTDEETDLNLPARGMPIDFSRAYHSYFPAGGGQLGPGWIHSYAAHLRQSATGLVFVNTDGEWPFDSRLDGTFAVPLALQAELLRTPSGYELRYRGGVRWTFDAQGGLVSQADLNGNAVTLQYGGTSSLLSTVTDGTGRVVLTFSYDPEGRLSNVRDVAGRTVAFEHDAQGHLTKVKDVLGNHRSFTYDDLHRLVSKTDYNGNLWTIAYDDQGRWSRSTDPLGYSYRAAYDYATGRVMHYDRRGMPTLYELGTQGEELARTDVLGNRMSFAYDANLNVTQQVDPRGASRRYTYDAEDNVIEEVSPLGTVTQHTYGPFGRRTGTVQDVHGLGVQTMSTYDERGNLLTTTNAEVNVTTYAYTIDGWPETITQVGGATTILEMDANGNVTAVTDPEGGTTSIRYNAAGHMIQMADALGNTRLMEVDAKGRLLSSTDPLGAVMTYSYDAQGNRLSVTHAVGSASETTYDALHRAIAVTDALGHSTRIEYDPEGNVTATVDAAGSLTSFVYDEAGRLLATTDTLGKVTSQGYCANDASDKPCDIVDAAGNVTRTEYDDEGRVVATVDALGLRVETAYDRLGRRTANLNKAGFVTSFFHDGAGRLASETDALGGVTRYGYDGRGNRTSVTDANGHTTTFTYDRANRLLTETTPIGTTHFYTYDIAGNRSSMLDPNGNTTTYVYDAARRLLGKHFSEGTMHRFEYDKRGNKTLEYAPAITRTYTYDLLGRVATVADHRFSPHKVLAYTYDERGNRASMTLTPDNLKTIYRYDSRGLLSELTDPDGDVTRFAYDELGRRTALRHPNGVIGTYAYSARSEITSIAWKRRTGELLNLAAYSYESRGNRTSKTSENGDLETYGYDALSRLIHVEYPRGTRTVDYNYDSVSNRLSMTDSSNGTTSETTYTLNQVNQIIGQRGSGSGERDEYDNRGNLVKVVSEHGTTEFSWNGWNSLSTIRFNDGHIERYDYDSNGLRVAIHSGNESQLIVMDGFDELAEYHVEGTAIVRYNRDPSRLDTLLNQNISSVSTYVLMDELGSVFGMTDEEGFTTEMYGYDAFGARTDDGMPTTVWGYTGRRHDPVSKLIYHRARYRHPGTGMWLQPDPLGHVDGSNLYLYVHARPTFYSDPTGLFADSITMGAFVNIHTFLQLMAILGFLTLAKEAVRRCPRARHDGIETFYRGDSYERAKRSVEYGFLVAGIGRGPENQLGVGLYMSRDPEVAVPYAVAGSQGHGRGALLEIKIPSAVWDEVMLFGASDNVPQVPGSGLQTFVPFGPALTLFDFSSIKTILVQY